MAPLRCQNHSKGGNPRRFTLDSFNQVHTFNILAHDSSSDSGNDRFFIFTVESQIERLKNRKIVLARNLRRRSENQLSVSYNLWRHLRHCSTVITTTSVFSVRELKLYQSYHLHLCRLYLLF